MTVLLRLSLILCVRIIFSERTDPNNLYEVSTPTGNITGLQEKVTLKGVGYTVLRFRGIPYGEAPVRFRKSTLRAYFDSTFDATNDGPVCYQAEQPNNSKYNRSEDCLRLNIFAPSTNENLLRPVMVWFHGGGFIHGESYSYNATMLSVIGDVVVVTINYRLAHLGFFTTGDDIAPGNYGLWDQRLALQWVARNIVAFNGDPNRVTVFGGSAGASSVLYQAFYPGNIGLFKRVIAQSGTTLSPWAFKGYYNQKVSRRFAENAGCKQENPEDYTECLRALPIETLNLAMNSITSGVPGPVLDNDFILDRPENILSGYLDDIVALDMFGSVDLMIGYNSADGMKDLFLWMNATGCDNLNSCNFRLPKDKYAQELVPYYLNVYFNNTLNNFERLVPIVIGEYTDLCSPDDEDNRIMKLIKLATDCNLAVSTVKTAAVHLVGQVYGTTTYAYEFAVQPLRKKYPTLSFFDRKDMMSHGDEISYVFGMGVEQVSDDQNQTFKFQTYLATMKMWANFAHSGNPNTPNDVSEYIKTTWPEFTDNWDYLQITPNMSTDSSKTRMRAQSVDFWENVLPVVAGHFQDDDAVSCV